MKIKKVESKENEYPKANEVSAEETKKNLPKKFLKLSALGVGAAALVYGVVLYREITTVDIPLSGDVMINTNYLLDPYSGEQTGSNVKLFLKEIEKFNSQDAFPVDVTGKVEIDIEKNKTYSIEFFDNNSDNYIDTYHIKSKE